MKGKCSSEYYQQLSFKCFLKASFIAELLSSVNGLKYKTGSMFQHELTMSLVHMCDAEHTVNTLFTKLKNISIDNVLNTRVNLIRYSNCKKEVILL